jgi:hypothetical protein
MEYKVRKMDYDDQGQDGWQVQFKQQGIRLEMNVRGPGNPIHTGQAMVRTLGSPIRTSRGLMAKHRKCCAIPS